jgi:hypothetical protein
MPGIRAVLVTGCLSGNLVGLALLTFEGHLSESLRLNPIALLGAILEVGIAGMLVGAVCGLFLRLRLEKQGAADVWQGPVVVSAAASALVGFLIANAAISALW